MITWEEPQLEYTSKESFPLRNDSYEIIGICINDIIVEVKAQAKTVEQHYSQIINYMTISKAKVGLLINFGESSLQFKRFVL